MNTQTLKLICWQTYWMTNKKANKLKNHIDISNKKKKRRSYADTIIVYDISTVIVDIENVHASDASCSC